MCLTKRFIVRRGHVVEVNNMMYKKKTNVHLPFLFRGLAQKSYAYRAIWSIINYCFSERIMFYPYDFHFFFAVTSEMNAQNRDSKPAGLCGLQHTLISFWTKQFNNNNNSIDV